MSERLNWWTVVEGSGNSGTELRSWTNEGQARSAATWYETEKGRDATHVGPQPDKDAIDPDAVLEEYCDSDDSEEES